MQIQKGKSGSVAKIYAVNFDDLLKDLLEIQNDEELRAVVLIFEKIEIAGLVKKDLTDIIRNFPVPVIAAVSGEIPEHILGLIESLHLCVASESNKFPDLINRSVAPEDVETEAFVLAEKISELAPLAVRACLRAVNRGLEISLKDGLKLETELFTRICATEDMREGTRAFLEKRPPVFRGK